jgi:hypothetical protein
MSGNKKEKTLKESIIDLKKLLEIQEKSLNIKAARMTKKLIETFETRIKKEIK